MWKKSASDITSIGVLPVSNGNEVVQEFSKK